RARAGVAAPPRWLWLGHPSLRWRTIGPPGGARGVRAAADVDFTVPDCLRGRATDASPEPHDPPPDRAAARPRSDDADRRRVRRRTSAVRPSQEFRFWLRRAPTGERVAAGVATLIAVALLAWLLVPGSGGGATNLAASGGAGASSAEGSGPGEGAGVPVAQGTGAAASGPGAGIVGGRGTGGQAGGATSAG